MLEIHSKRYTGLALATLLSLGGATAALAAPLPVAPASRAMTTPSGVVAVVYRGRHGYGHRGHRRNYYRHGAAGVGVGAAGLALGAMGAAAAVASGGYGPYGYGNRGYYGGGY